MNDLMTRSFLNYAELKKQALRDLQSEDLSNETLNPESEHNLSFFYQEVERIKSQMSKTAPLVQTLQALNEDTKTTHSFNLLRRLRDQMDADTVAISRKVKAIKARIEFLDRSNVENRQNSTLFKEGSAVDRTRMGITNCLKVKFKEMMSGFANLRDTIVDDHKGELRRKYYNATGEAPTEEIVEQLASGKMVVEMFEAGKDRKMGLDLESREKQEAMADIKKSLERLHQVFLDMAVLVEEQGEQLDDIEKNMASAGQCINGGTNNLYYSKQMQNNRKKWVLWVLAAMFVIIVVCLVASFAS